jgi:hypothetical protein
MYPPPCWDVSRYGSILWTTRSGTGIVSERPWKLTDGEDVIKALALRKTGDVRRRTVTRNKILMCDYRKRFYFTLFYHTFRESGVKLAQVLCKNYVKASTRQSSAILGAFSPERCFPKRQEVSVVQTETSQEQSFWGARQRYYDVSCQRAQSRGSSTAAGPRIVSSA